MGASQSAAGAGQSQGDAFGPAELCGTRLATAHADGTVKVWNTSFSRELFTLVEPNARAVAISPDGARVAAGLPGGRVGVWDVASPAAREVGGEPSLTWQAQDGAISSMAFSPDGKQLAVAGDDR